MRLLSFGTGVGIYRPVRSAAVNLTELTERQNRGMVVFDLVLGAGALLAPSATLRVLGHDQPSPDAEWLFRRAGPIWLTFSAAHAVAAHRGRPEDWWAVAWLRGTELFTDVVWARSPAIRRPFHRTALRLAGAGNLAMAVAYAARARRG
jgi:hypothetical protein